MKFPRNARIFRGQLDAAPFATVFFLLILFLLLSTISYTPGLRVHLPVAKDLPGTDKPSVKVAITQSGQMYYENQLIDARKLRLELAEARKRVGEPLTLILEMDEGVTYGMELNIELLARDAGITDVHRATLPGSSLPPIRRSGK